MKTKNLTQTEIEKLEKKYLNKYYHFLKFAEDEMIEGFKTKDDIRDDYMDVKSEVFWEDIEGNVKGIKDKLKRKVITKKILGKKLK